MTLGGLPWCGLLSAAAAAAGTAATSNCSWCQQAEALPRTATSPIDATAWQVNNMLWNAVFGMGVCYPLWRMRGPRCAALRPTSWRLPALFDPRRTLGEAHCSARGAAGSPTWDTTQLLHLAAYPIIADLWFFCAHRAMHTHVAPLPSILFQSSHAHTLAKKPPGAYPTGVRHRVVLCCISASTRCTTASGRPKRSVARTAIRWR